MSTHLFTHFIPSTPLQAAMHFFEYKSGDATGMLPLIGIWSFIAVLVLMLYKIESYKKKEFLLLNRIHEQQEHELDIQEAERRRIAADLHDEIGSSLAAIKINLQSLRYRSVHDEQRATSLLELVDQTSQNVRRATHNLIPPHFETTPFTSILQSYFSSLDSQNTIAFHYYCNAYQHYFTTRQELLLYRVVMELTNNIIRHAKASEATIQILFCATYLEIMVEDNGIGFTTANKKGIDLVDANRKDIGFMEATRKDIHFTEATRKDISSPEPTRKDIGFTEATRKDIDFTEAIRKDISSTEANRKDIGFTEANRKDISSTEANRKDIHFTEANRKDISSTEANRKDIYFREATRKDISSTEANRKDISSTEATRKDTDFTEATRKDISSPEATRKDIDFTEATQHGIGLLSVNTRVKSLGGNIHIDTGRCGTTIIIHVPVSCEHAC